MGKHGLGGLIAQVRGYMAANAPETGKVGLQANNRGDLSVVQGMPELVEIVRLGNSWMVVTASAIAALTAIPTTAAGLSLWNGEPAGGKSYIIDSIGYEKIVVDATQTDQAALHVMMNAIPVAAPTDAALAIRSLSGRSKYGGRARTLANGAVTNDGWLPYGTSPGGAAAAAGSAWNVADYPVDGLFIVPPGGMFNLHLVEVAAAATQVQFFMRCHEVQLLLLP